MMKNRIIRVFPRRNNFTPVDDMVRIGYPDMLPLPEHDEVHISCVFTWDKALCEDMKLSWEMKTDKPVLIGGPAYESPCEGFQPGMYIKNGVTFTTRGCNNNCPWCCVPRIEGKLAEIEDFAPGNIIQDNNFLQASEKHKDRVFEMLKTQSKIQFKGGLDADLLDDHFIQGIKDLRIDELWLACDTDADIPAVTKAIKKLADAGYSRHKVRCYCLIGNNGTSEFEMELAENRLTEVYQAGAMPFAQLYRDFSGQKTEYPKEWIKFNHQWTRPAAIEAHMKHGTWYTDYNT